MKSPPCEYNRLDGGDHASLLQDRRKDSEQRGGTTTALRMCRMTASIPFWYIQQRGEKENGKQMKEAEIPSNVVRCSNPRSASGYIADLKRSVW
ncbi:hypothetical protein GTNG_0287 [Geobacillus thermodenitrificans NG80-2]|uniref:Uncharacterized protein n=1 Tax=Geobacillus thermodenitrificans (strain NG80-2) TaxID=420246 RepID=A4IK17_GEOTN|nr:hypothetical protein GTNG_0287 [Geobacillus thermodenitrificans NG80-2]